MGNKKISEFVITSTPLDGTEKMPGVQAGVNVGITPALIKSYVASFGLPAILAGNNSTGSSVIILNTETANTVPIINGSKQLVSSSVSSTALGYIANVTSDVQSQFNALQTGLSWKNAVKCVVASNTALSGFPTVPSVTFSDGDRVLLISQTDAKQNGIWLVSGGPWTRPSDFAAGATTNIAACVVPVQKGDYADQAFICSTDAPITVGSTSIAFTEWGGTTYIGTAGEISVTGNVISFNGSISTSKTDAKIKGSVGSSVGLIAFGTGTADTVVTDTNLFYDGAYVNTPRMRILDQYIYGDSIKPYVYLTNAGGAELGYTAENSIHFGNGAAYMIVGGMQCFYSENGAILLTSGTATPKSKFGVMGTSSFGDNNIATAFVDMAAGTTSAAQARFRAGSTPSAPNDGEIWYDGTDLKMKIGGTIKTFQLT